MAAPPSRQPGTTRSREPLDPPGNTDRVRLLLFLALCALTVAVTLAYTWARGGRDADVREVRLPPVTRSPLADLPALPSPPRRGDVKPAMAGEAQGSTFLIRHTGLDLSYGALAVEYGSGASAKREA